MEILYLDIIFKLISLKTYYHKFRCGKRFLKATLEASEERRRRLLKRESLRHFCTRPQDKIF